MAREIKQWITMNGQHIPIFKGESKEDAVNRAIANKNDDIKQKQIARNRKVADSLNKKVSITSVSESEKDQKKGDFLTDLKGDNPDYEKIATDINDSVETAGYMMLEKDGKVTLFGKNYNDNFSEVGPEKPTRGMDSVGMAKRIKADIDGKWSTHKYDGQVQFPVRAINKNAPANGFYNAIIIDQIPSSASVQKIMTTPDGKYGVYRIKNIGNKMFEYVAIKG